MPSAADRIDFGPPRDPGSVRAYGLALLAHALLVIALTWGVSWKRTDTSATSYDAEIWSAVPQQVAPRLIETPVTPPPPPPPEPAAKVPEVKAPPPAPEVDIALEQEKKRKQLVQLKEADAKKALDKELKAKDEQARRVAADDAKKLAAQKLAKQQETVKQAQAEAEKERQANIQRITGLAGASGAANDTGTAMKSAGPSASYGGKLRAAIRPNVVFTEEIVGNPIATVRVRVMSDGTIISQQLLKSSGDKNWDEAAISAIIRTRVLPRDIDGRMPDTILDIVMRARE